MIDEIRSHLRQLETTRGIRILLAVESGSRAWGFPSPDSDYDVRIIYAQPENWYLSLGNRKDTIKYFHGALLDIGGWELRKALHLLSKSNATPAEWGQSPIIYEEREGFRAQLLTFVRYYFNPYHTLNHYRGIALNSWRSGQLVGKIKLKKLFYVIRPVLAARWIIEHGTVPPMDIQSLLTVVGDEQIKERIEQLIELKSGKNEDYQHEVHPEMKTYLTKQFGLLDHAQLEKSATLSLEPLNEFFRNTIRSQI